MGRKSFGIRNRILLAALAPAALVALLVSALLVAEHLRQARIDQHSRLAAVARQLTSAAEYNIFVGNNEGLLHLLDTALQEPDIVAAAFLDPRGMVLASTVPVAQLPAPDQRNFGLQIADYLLIEPRHWHELDIRPAILGEPDLFDPQPQMRAQLVGKLLLQITDAPLQSEMLRYSIKAAGISALILAFGVLLALELSRGLIRTLTDIREVVGEIGQGRHDRRAKHVRDDELGHLAQGINVMADAVAQTQEDLNRRITEATATLRRERDDAAQAAEARSRFFAAASHDLRQPVQALGLFVTRLEHEARRSTLLPRIRLLAHSVRNLQGLLDTLLDYSRLSGQVFRVDARPVRAADALGAVLTEFEPVAAGKNLTLRLRAADCWLQTDPALLHRILLNLVGNAIRHTQRGKVLLACRRSGTHARIEIWDTGPGIPPEYQESVFEELVQLGNPERAPSKGLGLGLAIVRRTANLLNHPLTLRSRVGKGSCFAVTIPLAEPPEADIAGTASTPDYAERVFVFGASLPELSELIDLLDSWDYAVTQAETAEEVGEWIATHGAPALLVCETGGKLAAVLDTLDGFDAAAGAPLPALLIHPGPAGDVDTRSERRLLLARPFRPARLRALVGFLLEPDATGE